MDRSEHYVVIPKLKMFVVKQPVNESISPAKRVHLRFSVELIALFADSIQSRKLGFIIDSHAAETRETPLFRVGTQRQPH